jgi:hypothetical protein
MMEAPSSSETSALTRATRLTSQKMPFFIVTALKTANYIHGVISQKIKLVMYAFVTDDSAKEWELFFLKEVI